MCLGHAEHAPQPVESAALVVPQFLPQPPKTSGFGSRLLHASRSSPPLLRLRACQALPPPAGAGQRRAILSYGHPRHLKGVDKFNDYFIRYY